MTMDIRSGFIFSIFVLIPVQGQVLDNMLDDFILIGDKDNGAVCRMDINNNYSIVYIAFPSWISPYDIDYDPVDHVIYWNYWSSNWVISSGSLFGNSEKNVRFAQTGGITVDSISRLLFYTDMKNHIIVAIRLEDSFQKTVISSGLVNPRAIVTDPINGTIYWVDSGSPAKIEKSNYDGTNRQELVNNGLSSPYDLAVDINEGRLYWCEISTLTIERANVDGSNRSLIYQEQESVSGCSIALYHSYLYFTTWYNRYSLLRIGTDGRGLISVASSEYIYPLVIHVHINGRLGKNGCSIASGGCSHFCFPLPGGYKECACPDLMTLQTDGKTCRQDDLYDEFIIASNGYGDLHRIHINNNYSYVKLPFPNLGYIHDIDYDRTDAMIYWVHGNIYSGSILGMNIKTVGIAKTSGIAVDSKSRLLFYTDLEYRIIAAISLQDYAQKTVISSGLVSPGAIVVDPINGKIYWVDLGSPAKIETSNYDGTNRQEVVNTGLSSPFGLDVDINAGVLYWCEIGTFTIERANVDGSNRSLIYQEQGRVDGCSIALYQSYLYFVRGHWHVRNVIMRIGTDGSGLISFTPSPNTFTLGIHVNHNGHLGSNGCSNGSGGCSHFCFPQHSGSNACACPEVMTLQSDGKTCQIDTTDTLPENFLLVTGGSIYRMEIDNYTYVSIPIQNGSYPKSIDYDPNAAVMFWTDLSFRQINSGSIYGNNQNTLRGFKNYAGLNDIAVDLISRLLFYTDNGQNIIAVISLDENVTKTVISDDLNSPQAIVTDPTNGIIYWSSVNKIEKSNYDGTSRQEVISTGLYDNVDLAVNFNVGVMYWCHYNTRKIELANVDGSNRQVLYQDQGAMYTYINKCSIALYQSYLYYIDSSQSALMRIRTDGSGMTSIGPSIFHDVKDIHVHSNTSLNQGINGCSNGRGGCSHFCFPQPGGSKVCDCPDDMTLQPDGLSCGNYNLPETFLLIMDSNNRDIYLMDIRNFRYVTIALENKYSPYAIAYDPIYRNIYWTDDRFRQILSVSIDGNIQRTVRQLNRSAYKLGIAVDVLSRILFYADYRIIAALSLDGSMHKIVINNTNAYPSAIAIDPINGTIYWIADGKIEKSNYDGTNRQEVINGLENPNDLTIDIRAGVLYWCGGFFTYTIERANVDGTNRQIVYHEQHAFFHTFSKIALHQSHLFITGYLQRFSMIRIGTDGSNLVLVGPSQWIHSTICLHSNKSASLGSNGCSSRNGGCSHFCFPRPGGRKMCDCPDGLTLRADGHTCRSYENVCDDQSCKNSAVCTNIDGSYVCKCSREWQGQNCSSDIDECLDNPCQNGGICSNSDGSYLCNCSSGWRGQNCSSDIDECIDNPCQHGGMCSNTDGAYLCNCSRGWQGRHCSSDTDECIDNPCQNGGMCSNTNGSYLCNCSRGWQGHNCSSDIDECRDTPCQNSGMCNNTDGSYLCNCSRGWQGQNCSDAPPSPVKQFYFHRLLDKYMEFYFVPGFNGGYQQTFTIQFKTPGSLDESWKNTSINGLSEIDDRYRLPNGTFLVQVEKLQPGSYVFRMFSVTEKNILTYSQEVPVYIEAVEHTPSTLGIPVAGIAGGVSAGFVLILVMGLGIFLWRRSQQIKQNEDANGVMREQYERHDAASGQDYEGLHLNRGEASPYLQLNDIRLEENRNANTRPPENDFYETLHTYANNDIQMYSALKIPKISKDSERMYENTQIK